jgi:hypothetical protein
MQQTQDNCFSITWIWVRCSSTWDSLNRDFLCDARARAHVHSFVSVLGMP